MEAHESSDDMYSKRLLTGKMALRYISDDVRSPSRVSGRKWKSFQQGVIDIDIGLITVNASSVKKCTEKGG